MTRLYIWKKDETFFVSLQNMSFFVNTYIPFSDIFSKIEIVPEISYNTLLILDNPSKSHDFYFWCKELVKNNIESGVSFKILVPKGISKDVYDALENLSKQFSIDLLSSEKNIYARKREDIPQGFEAINSLILDFPIDIDLVNTLIDKVSSLNFLGLRLDFLDQLVDENEILFFDAQKNSFRAIKLDDYISISERRVNLLDSFKGEKSILASIYPILISYAKSDDEKTRKIVLNQLSLVELYIAFDF